MNVGGCLSFAHLHFIMAHWNYRLWRCTKDRPLIILQAGQPGLSRCERIVLVKVSGSPSLLHSFMHRALHASVWRQPRRKPSILQPVNQATQPGYVYGLLLAFMVVIGTVLHRKVCCKTILVLLMVMGYVTPTLKLVKLCFRDPCKFQAHSFHTVLNRQNYWINVMLIVSRTLSSLGLHSVGRVRDP